MTTGLLNSAIQQLHRAGLALHGSQRTDAELLQSFLDRQDAIAFEALVRRHGPMVLGVCRRVLHNGHDAEDAFQATFLVLVRKASSIVPPGLVGNWLHGVAYRVATKARATASKRRALERKAKPLTQAPEATDSMGRDWQPMLDRELHQLPEKYRAPVVLCDLEGKTRSEAARQLGWPVGTLSWRLAAARELLAKRLTRRGLTLSAAGLGLVMVRQASAGVPPTLRAATVKFARLSAGGPVYLPGLVSPEITALTQGVLHTMFWTRLKSAWALALVIAVLATGAGIGSYPNQAPATYGNSAPDLRLGAVRNPARQTRGGDDRPTRAAAPIQLVAKKLAPALLGQPLKPADFTRMAAFSPDGKALAITCQNHSVYLWDLVTRNAIPLSNKGSHYNGPIAFSPDGKILAATRGAGKHFVGDRSMIQLWEVATGREIGSFDTSRHESAIATVVFSPDGKTVLAAATGGGIFFLDVPTKKQVGSLDEGGQTSLLFSPDGRTLAICGHDVNQAENGAPGLSQPVLLWDFVKKEKITTLRIQSDGPVNALAFSLDGMFLATATDRVIRVWDLPKRKQVAILTGHHDTVSSIAFLPGGRALLSGSEDCTLRLWELASSKQVRVVRSDAPEKEDRMVGPVVLTPDGRVAATTHWDQAIRFWNASTGKAIGEAGEEPNTPIGKLGDRELGALWTDLAADNPVKAFQAMDRLMAAADQTVPYLRQQLRPAVVVSPPDRQHVARLLANLDQDRFVVREKAAEELEKLGPVIVPALKHRLEGKPTLETRRRIERLLEKLETDLPTPDELQALRSVQVLTEIASPSARELLEQYARGAAGARLTERARTALAGLALHGGRP